MLPQLGSRSTPGPKLVACDDSADRADPRKSRVGDPDLGRNQKSTESCKGTLLFAILHQPSICPQSLPVSSKVPSRKGAALGI